MAHSDIAAGDWIDRRVPEGLRPYARLMRLDRPIGTWLLLWPCWWGLVLAGEGWPPVGMLLLFAFGALVMRGAGCAINDLVDRDIDRKVERTLTRPLARGDVKVWQALLFVAFLLLVGLGVLLCFNGFTVGLGVSSLFLVFTYPLAKRVIWAPQFVLGLAFNWGALMGWSAVREGLGLPASFLYLGGILWTLGYDTIYAHQDKRDDALVGVKSLALYLGDQSRRWIAGFYAAALVCFSLAGFLGDVGMAFYVVMPAAFAHAVWQLASWKPDDPANCLVRFRSNRDFGLIVFLALLAGRVL